MMRFKRPRRVVVDPRGPMTITPRPDTEGNAVHLTIRDQERGTNLLLVLPRHGGWSSIVRVLEGADRRLRAREKAIAEREAAVQARIEAELEVREIKALHASVPPGIREKLNRLNSRHMLDDWRDHRTMLARMQHVQTYEIHYTYFDAHADRGLNAEYALIDLESYEDESPHRLSKPLKVQGTALRDQLEDEQGGPLVDYRVTAGPNAQRVIRQRTAQPSGQLVFL